MTQPSASKKERILITGGAGFIGSHMADALVAGGHEVGVIDDFSTGSRENVEQLIGHPRFHLTRASITDEIVLDRLVSESDVVIHLAAAVGVRLIMMTLTCIAGAQHIPSTSTCRRAAA